jgi:hypothetical protein
MDAFVSFENVRFESEQLPVVNIVQIGSMPDEANLKED